MIWSAVLAAAVAERIENAIESVSGPWLYVVAGVLTFAETGTLFFLVPGEIGSARGGGGGRGREPQPHRDVDRCQRGRPGR